MGKNIIALILLLLAISPFANAENVYYCATELNVGIEKNKKTGLWQSILFPPQRYTIKFNSDYSKLEGIKKDFIYNCYRPYPSVPDTLNLLVCYDTFNAGTLFQFDKKTLRYLYAFLGTTGYLENTNDTNNMEGGTCQKF